MLGKLIKHEFRATSKKMWPIFAGMVILAVLTRFVAMPLLDLNTNSLFKFLAGLISFAFVVGVLAVGFIPLIVSGSRFKTSILGQEGYTTMTLPVSGKTILAAKLITNAVWYFLAGILMIVIAYVMGKGFLRFSFNGEFLELFQDLTREQASQMGHIVLAVAEVLCDLVAGITLLTIMVYAAYSIGYSANRRKSLWTVLLIYGFFHIITGILIGSLFFLGREDLRFNEFSLAMKAFEGFLAWEFVVMILTAAGFFFLTDYFITRKLNLE